MNIKRVTLYVDGMTCGSCEARITKVLSGLRGVLSAEARAKGGRVAVEYDADLADLRAIEDAIEKTGYPIRGKKSAGTALALGIGFLLIAAYLIAGASGVFSSLPQVDSNVGYAMLFAIGLLTSIHCVAMCGGIALSQSVGTGESAASEDSPLAARFSQLRPGLSYNAGRVVSYTAIGAAVGAFGAAFNFSPAAKGVIAALAGAFMVLFALRMLGAIRLPDLPVPAPLRKAGNAAAARLGRGGPFAVGVLNGLMPCGPLQTMQLYALGTGSAAAGALSMFVFSVGTVPLMLIFGLTATLLPRKFVPVMVKASAVLVMFLGAVTFVRAASLAGIALPSMTAPAYASVPPSLPGASSAGNPSVGGNAVNAGLVKAVVSGGKQTVLTEFKNGRYVPFAVQAGIPLVWTIRIAAEDITGCNGELIVPAYNIRKKLEPGDNVVEFTPAKAGRIAYSCWMGMIRSSITVAESIGMDAAVAAPQDDGLALPAGMSCCAAQ